MVIGNLLASNQIQIARSEVQILGLKSNILGYLKMSKHCFNYQHLYATIESTFVVINTMLTHNMFSCNIIY